MTIAYDGSNYSGWQIQPNGLSIQEVIQKALGIALRTSCHVTGAGRTDAGVHALGQVAHFVYDDAIDLVKLQRSLNGLLPQDIRINSIEEASPDFHACHSATGKIYRYHVHFDRVLDPFTRLYSWHLFEPIDLELLKRATESFIGTRDFTSFANEAHKGCAARNAVRTIDRITHIPAARSICLEFEGNGFLYKMVRNIVGTAMSVAMGKRPLASIADIFAAKDRRKADAAAPPHGLFLVQVFYTDVYR
jgi:tRNA pseudouridine38-40 synthase